MQCRRRSCQMWPWLAVAALYLGTRSGDVVARPPVSGGKCSSRDCGVTHRGVV